MAKQKIAPITASNVGRTRIVGRDVDGVNLEEKLCPLRSEVFVDMEGNEMPHPLENGRIPSSEGARDGQRLKEDGIRDHGWLPLAECPFTDRYRYLVNGPLVRPAEGEKDCGGAPGGCSHLRTIQASRRAKSRAAAVERNRPADDPNAAATAQLAQSIGKWAEAMNGAAPSIKDARTRLREGKGEEARG